MRILTTKGFTEKQYVDAALSYAAYFDFKGTPETAFEMYKWALDIATSNDEAKSMIDCKTAIIANNKTPSENVLHVSRAIAVHHATSSNLSLALPIFLSVLRAHRSLPEPPIPDAPKQIEERSIMKAITRLVSSAFVAPTHLPPPSDGTQPPMRTPSERCEEAGIMANVGEILYAAKTSASSKEDGLAWTREAVDIAEEQLTRARLDTEGARACKQCLGVAIANWDTMVAKLAKDEREAKKEGVKVGGWLGFGGEVQKDVIGRWESEEGVVRERRRRAVDILEKGSAPTKRWSPASFMTV